MSVHIFFAVSCNELVFGTYTVGAVDVDARFIGGDHACLKGLAVISLGHDSPSESVWRFMHIEHIADAVPRAGQIVDALPPHCSSCKDIKVVASASVKEFRHRQIDHTLEHEGEVPFECLAHRADSIGSCNVCGSAEVLSAGVNQVELPCFNCCIARFACRIVHHGSICAESRNRVEARLNKALLLFSEVLHFLLQG